MSALLELIKETPPEDRRKIAEYLKPYLVTEKKPVVEHWVNIEKTTTIYTWEEIQSMDSVICFGCLPKNKKVVN